MEEDPDAVVAKRMAHPTRATRGLMLVEIYLGVQSVQLYAFGPSNLGSMKCEGGERRVQEEAAAIVEWRAEQQRETTVDGLDVGHFADFGEEDSES